MSIPTISPLDLAELCRQGPVKLIDVRTPAEFQEIHIPAARSIPLDQLQAASLPTDTTGDALYVVCQSGGRGRQACEKLIAAGLASVFNVEGGTTAWVAAGLPVVRGKKTISLERQVRIAAGSLVLLGSLLAVLIHWAFMALPAFVGAGLIFAGVTDTCGMGLLLARMPWNRAGSCNSNGVAQPLTSPKEHSQTRTLASHQ